MHRIKTLRIKKDIVTVVAAPEDKPADEYTLYYELTHRGVEFIEDTLECPQGHCHVISIQRVQVEAEMIGQLRKRGIDPNKPRERKRVPAARV